MSVTKGVYRILASFLIGVSVSLLLLLLFLGQMQVQLDDIDAVIDRSIEKFILEDSDAILQTLEADPAYADYEALCDSGALSEEECAITLENPLIQESFVEGKDELKEGIVDSFSFVSVYSALIIPGYALVLLLFIFGLVALYFGCDKDWLLFGRKLSGRLAWSFSFSFLAVWYILNLSRDDIVSQLGSLMIGSPEILLLFVGTLLLELFRPVFTPFYWPFLFVAATSLGLWLLFLAISFARRRKKKRKA